MIKNKLLGLVASITIAGVVILSLPPHNIEDTKVQNKVLLTAPVASKDLTLTAQNSTYNTISYNTTLSNYISNELQNYISNTGEGGQTVQNNLYAAINPANDDNELQYLNVNQYRNINEDELATILQGKGVFSGQTQTFINAAKQYNIDPLYLVAKSAQETGWGTTTFAKGITISQIANTNAPIYNSNGELTGYQMINLSAPVTVYNLFGIGAYNASSSFPNKTQILGTTYAYNHGWTSISSAINGAAQFLSTNYLHSTTSNQITPFEIRFNPNTNEIWHQYATDINYPVEIANTIGKYSDLYSPGDIFTFSVPTFNS